MNILMTILQVLAGIIFMLLLAGIFMTRNHYVKSEILISAPSNSVFDYVKLLKNQDHFNSGAMADADRLREFKGVDGTEGYIYSWSGNKDAGQGEKEIIKIVAGERIESEIRFVKPMVTSAYIIMETIPVSANQTKVTWSNAGKLNYPFNILIPIMERHVSRDMDKSLQRLKKILEGSSSFIS